MQNVYHIKYGEGKLVENADVVIVEFKSGIMKFLNNAWGKHLFLSEEDMVCADKAVVAEKYSRLIIQSESQREGYKEVPLNELKDRFCIDHVNKTCKRRIFILHREDVEIGRKKFVRIVGIDLDTGKLVRVVDTNGIEKGFHSYNESAQKLKKDLIIRATFELKQSEDYCNLLRITSDSEILEKTTFSELRKKLDREGIQVQKQIGDIISFSERVAGCNFYCVTFIACSQLRQHNNEYHLRIGGVFVDVLAGEDTLSRRNGLYFKGWALLEVMGRKNQVKAHRLLGVFNTFENLMKEEKRNWMMRQKKAGFFEYIKVPGGAELEHPDMELILSECDEEYFDARELDSFQELDNFEEMMPDVLEEYGDYYAEEYSDDFRERNFAASIDDDADDE